jgi:DNA-binding transcriptional ArsR family regulator
MATNKYLMISLDDEKSKHIAEVLGNKTCRKILDYLTENKQASETDLSSKLNLPLNTIEYNIKKLLKAELIQKSKNFFWSKKLKKIKMYELAKKHIIISPKSSKPSYSKLKSIIPSIIISGAITTGIYLYQKTQIPLAQIKRTSEDMLTRAPEAAGALSEASNTINIIGLPIWLWFLIGSLLAITIFTILNWKKL